MTRKEIYGVIKKHNLATFVKQFYGKNYTNCTTKQLEDYISKEVSVPKSCKVSKLVEVLKKKHILLSSEVEYILK